MINSPKRKQKGTVYLIHFARPYKHAAHYIGFTKSESPLRRLRVHRSGYGARLLLVLNCEGIAYNVVRTWPGTNRDFERQLKKRKNAAKICPYCNAKLAKKRYRLHKK